MAINRMLKMQLLGHHSIREDVKLYLREAGVIEITDISLEQVTASFDEAEVREAERLHEKTDDAIQFLDNYSKKLTFIERLSRGPLVATPEEIATLSEEVDVIDIWAQCNELQNTMRSCRDNLARSRELIGALEPWTIITVPLESLTAEQYTVQFWTLPEKVAESDLEDMEEKFPLVQFLECTRRGGRSYIAAILAVPEAGAVGEALKQRGGFLNAFENLKGTPAEIIAREKDRLLALEHEIERAEAAARELAAVTGKLLILSDHFNEVRGLKSVERHFHFTDSTFLIEGWVRAIDRRRLEKKLPEMFRDTEIMFRPPRDDEEPPINLENRSAVRPFEFVTTLYGRPIYREVDPTPLLAPFFVLFFALCLTDAGYGLTLAAVSGFLIFKLKPAGGAGLLLRLLFTGGVVTAIVGVITGGIFGIDPASFSPFIRQIVFINPLEEPMKMLNIAFLMGVVHILFGMGIRMVAHWRAGLISDAVFDDLLWILFLMALAPLGYSAILGGEIPPEVAFWSKRASIVIAAAIFITGGRKQNGIVKKVFKGLIGFYDVVGYFGDVLSYARLLALGLATSAIALAVNGIAGMVTGLPFYTGYIMAALILILGHAFNLVVNTLGAFVHSGRLQYLEFFSKFFTGGGKEFRPFRSERRHSAMKETGNQY